MEKEYEEAIARGEIKEPTAEDLMDNKGEKSAPDPPKYGQLLPGYNREVEGEFKVEVVAKGRAESPNDIMLIIGDSMIESESLETGLRVLTGIQPLLVPLMGKKKHKFH